MRESAIRVDTSARSAGAPITLHRTTTARTELLKIVTPLRWQAWEEELGNAGVLEEFRDVVHNMRLGFPSGVSSTILHTFTPPNHASACNNPIPIQEYIDKELENGRYTGPFTKQELENIIGPFRSSPLGAVPKPGSSKIRLIQDLSFPRGDPTQASVNSEIDADDFPCDWSSFTDAFLMVARAPPGTEAAVFDVEAAFRRIPMRPEDQPHVVVMWLAKFFVDHCFCFGGASSPGIFGRVADALVRIFKGRGIVDILKWVDDFIFFRYGKRRPDGSFEFNYDADLIWNLGKKLGWPWAPEKFMPFATTFTYIGFSWDLVQKLVQVPPKKKTKYLLKIDPWVEGFRTTLDEVESLSGTLQHVCLAVPEGRSHQPSLWRFKKDFKKSKYPNFVKRRLPHYVLEDMEWWRTKLADDFCGSKVAAPAAPADVSVYVDASTSWGIGIVINGRWYAWKLVGDWKALNEQDSLDRRSIGWAEMVAVELVVLYLIKAGWAGQHIIVNSDNQGVIGALSAGRSKNMAQNASLRRIVNSLLESSTWVTTEYVNTKFNLADEPSRGIFSGSDTRLPNLVSIPRAISSFLKPVSHIPIVYRL